jgi:hypothetical protein
VCKPIWSEFLTGIDVLQSKFIALGAAKFRKRVARLRFKIITTRLKRTPFARAKRPTRKRCNNDDACNEEHALPSASCNINQTSRR